MSTAVLGGRHRYAGGGGSGIIVGLSSLRFRKLECQLLHAVIRPKQLGSGFAVDINSLGLI